MLIFPSTPESTPVVCLSGILIEPRSSQKRPVLHKTSPIHGHAQKRESRQAHMTTHTKACNCALSGDCSRSPCATVSHLTLNVISLCHLGAKGVVKQSDGADRCLLYCQGAGCQEYNTRSTGSCAHVTRQLHTRISESSLGRPQGKKT